MEKKRDTYVGATVTAEQKEKLTAAAKAHHMNLSEYIREAMFRELEDIRTDLDDREKYLTVKQVSDMLHVSESVVRRYLHGGKIPYTTICGQYRVERAAIEEMLVREQHMMKEDEAIGSQCFTTIQAAKYFNVDIGTVTNWIRKGKLKAYKVGRSYQIRKEDAYEFFEAHKCGTRQKN